MVEDEVHCLDFSGNQDLVEEEFRHPVQIFHNLMPFKVRDILLVSSLYDAFIVEQEGLISELVIWEYRHLVLSSPPRVTHVTSGEEALEKVKMKNYDLIITMSKNIGMDPITFGKNIKKTCPDIPVILLATDTADLHFCQEHVGEEGIDKSFFWYGDTSLFLAIIKYIEDKINTPYDTVNMDVQVIIFVEDSIRDYSKMLPIIYHEIVQQTQRSISEDLNEMQRLLRRKARPKILLTNNYDEGVRLYNRYKKNILGIISDVKFHKKGVLDPYAGHDFINFIKSDNKLIPSLLQSSDPKNRKKAEELGAYFIDKNSHNLMEDFNHFLLEHLGFGDFIFYKPLQEHYKGETDNIHHQGIKEIDRSSNLKEFEVALQKIPLESIRYHANRNDFSNWLMARGEFKLAKKLRPQRVSDFKTLDEMRKYLISVFNASRREKQLGIMTDFSQQKFEFKSSYTRIGQSSLGGKGRGIAFIRTLLARNNFDEKYPDVNITVPSTVAIGIDEFDKFMQKNNLPQYMIDNSSLTDKEIAEIFLKASFPYDLKEKLEVVLKHFKKPIAVRSSSLLEDSQNHPFAGMYSTYILPNNHDDDKIRLNQLCQAIKLIYASVFYKDAKAYLETTSAKIEEEKMAIIIQSLVGSKHGDRFYPTFSGVAQSYNFYPVLHQKREDGIASLAAGLGHFVVGGEEALRFSPKYPELIPEFSTPKDIFNNSQKQLYVLNLKDKSLRIAENEMASLEKIYVEDIAADGTLGYIASSYDREDGVIRDSFEEKGPHIITYAGILKYNVFPLVSILNDLLETGQRSMGCPVEIEFAINLNSDEGRPIFSIIQIRPFVILHEHEYISWDETEIIKENVLMYSKKALGNGIVEDITDIIYVSPETFDSTKTIEIAQEIGKINRLVNRPYILIGPGRWGTQDRFLGIPVQWGDISNVKVLVETTLKDFNIKPSQGTHFIQNIISRGIGYINITLKSDESKIDTRWFETVKPKNRLKYVKHLSLSTPLIVKLNGRKGQALILRN